MNDYAVHDINSMNVMIRARAAVIATGYDCGAGGVFNSPIAVIAEAPGPRETELKTPLIGGTGKLLWDNLRHENISRQQVYITNVIKRQLVTAANGVAKPKAPIGRGELEHWKVLLLDELSMLPNLRYILVLGNFALEALTGHSGVDKHRGSVYTVTHRGKTWQCVVTYNPAHVLREPRRMLTFRFDLNKLTRAVRGELHMPELTTHINPTLRDAVDFLRDLRAHPRTTAYDIETVNKETACIGFSASQTEAMCINFRDQRDNRFTLREEMVLRDEIQKTFLHPGIQWVAQNNAFDAGWLGHRDRIQVGPLWMDTMLAHHCLYPSLPHGLGYLTAQYTDYPYYKDELSEWRETGEIDDFWRYNGKDCIITLNCAFKMLHELRTEKLDAFFFNHIMALNPYLTKMQVSGVLADNVLKQQQVEAFTAKVEQDRAEVVRLVREATGLPDLTPNPGSWQQMQAVYFNHLRLVGHGVSTDEENRSRMRAHPRTSPIAKAMLTAVDTWSEGNKFLTTYANSRLDADNRFRCEYSQIGVASAPGRLSSRGTMWGNGLNLQNIPETAKDMFIADPGYMFVYFDAEQIEARYVAALADIALWLEQFERARLQPGAYDAHRALASVLYRMPYDDVPPFDFYPDGRPTVRYRAKRARHGLNYRMQAPRLSVTAGIPLRDAEHDFALYHSQQPEIMRWWDSIIREVRQHRCLWSPLGRRWILLEEFDPHSQAMDSVIAFKPQSTAGDHIASVIYKCERDPRWPRDARMVLNIHDADVALCRPDDAETVMSLMKLYAEQPILINGHNMIVPAAFAASVADARGVHKWSSLTKVKDRVVAAAPLNTAA